MSGVEDGGAPWAVPGDAKIVNVASYPLAFQESGDGAPLVLVHGSFNDYRGWALQVPDLSRSFRVLALSLRHYYPERWNGSGDDFSLARHAADVAEFIRHVNLGRVHLLGHSRGGAVALLVAMYNPELIRSLILADPRGLEDLLPDTPEGRQMAAQTAAMFERLHGDVKAGDLAAAARHFIDALAGPGAWDRRPAELKQMLLDNIATAVDTGELPGLTCSDVTRFDFPVLLVTGERSPKRYQEGFVAMRQCNQAIAETVVIPNAAHAMHRDNPSAFNAAVVTFLRSIGGPRATCVQLDAGKLL